METFAVIFISFLVIGTLLQLWLSQRHVHHILSHQAQVPSAFSDKVSLEDHQKAALYTITKVKVNQIDLIYKAAILLILTLGGGLEIIDNLIRSLNYNDIITGVIVFTSTLIIMEIIDIPFSIYRTFGIEERFGFNRTTKTLFFTDLIKEWLIFIMITSPLLALVLWIMQTLGEYWWLIAWLVIFGFMLLMSWAFPTFIAPLFNKFNPLEDSDLKTVIESLLNRCGFNSSGIFVMDGSKRSGHGNAYFTGMGKSKRIVFFDTLIKSLDKDEVEAVLAHELGHFKLHHIKKRLLTSAIISFSLFFLLGWLIQQSWFYHHLGISQQSNYMALLLFMLVMPVFSIFFAPVSSMLSRKHEFEADHYAVKQTSSQPLVNALVKMYQENASTLTPDPLYSAFYDSHPPAPVRINHIQMISE